MENGQTAATIFPVFLQILGRRAPCLQWQRAAQTSPSQHKPTEWTGPARVSTVTTDGSDLGSDLGSVVFHNFGRRRFDRRSGQTDEAVHLL